MEKARWAAKKMEKWKCAKQKKNSVSTGNGRGCSPCVAFDCLFERNAFCTNPVFYYYKSYIIFILYTYPCDKQGLQKKQIYSKLSLIKVKICFQIRGSLKWYLGPI